MERGKSNFLIGLGVGSVIGARRCLCALVYRFWHSPKGKCVKEKVNHAFQKVTGDSVNLIDTVNDKVLDAGTKVADKVADGTFYVAEKADDVRDKVHAMVDKAKK